MPKVLSIRKEPNPPKPSRIPGTMKNGFFDAILSGRNPPTKTANTPTKGRSPVTNPAWILDIPRTSL